jgi:hypothetical protein
LNDIANKKYNLVVKNLNIAGKTYNGYAVLDLNSTGNYVMYIKDILTGSTSEIVGNWSLNDSKVVLDYDSQPVMNLAIRVGYGKNTLVADGINGGFGVGVQALDINKSDLASYSYLKAIKVDTDKTEICFGHTSEKWINDNEINVTESDSECFYARSYPAQGIITLEQIPVPKPVTYTAEINPTIYVDNDNNPATPAVPVKLSGMAMVNTNNLNLVLFMDAKDGFYVNIGLRDLKESAAIGSNKFLQ